MSSSKTSVALLLLFVALIPLVINAKVKPKDRSIDDYLKQFPATTSSASVITPGSLFSSEGALIDLAADFRARRVGDPVIIAIVEQTTSQNSSSVNTKRDYSASMGIDGLAGKLSTNGVQTIFSGSGSSQLQGTGAAASQTQLRTTLAGQVVAVLPNGNLIVEARRSIKLNNEQQTVILRGMVRPGDLGRGNSVVSTQLANLELEVKGKGVLSDATRPPNWIIRTLLKLVGF
jgi:flagellar L-ring protein precursor FlgH